MKSLRVPALMLASPAILLAAALISAPPAAAQETRDDRLKGIEDRLDRIEKAIKSLADSQKAAGAAGAAAPPMATAKRDQYNRARQAIAKRQISSVREPNAGLAAGDRDQDELTDAEEAALGTDPDNPDTDGDALLDGWEVHGVNGLDLAAAGASPLHKDIFVEMDFMRRPGDMANAILAPNDAVLNGIRASFANAAVQNPDGIPGVNIHLERGNEVPYRDDLSPYRARFNEIKNAHFDPRKAPVYHYMIWANAYGGDSSSGVSMGIPHSDFLVTLGRWNNGAGGNDLQKIGTFIHELGHNLGRMHGGSEHVNFKPNHLSIMNYNYQTRGISVNGQRVFDYQRFSLPGLNENRLRERDGLGLSANLRGYLVIYFLPNGSAVEVPADLAIDWNGDGSVTPGNVVVNINRDNMFGELLATPDEWSQIIYNGGSIGSTDSFAGAMEEARSLAVELPFVELTEEMDRQLSAPRRAAAPAAAPGGGPGAANALPQPAELDEATDRAVGEALRKGAEARKPRS